MAKGSRGCGDVKSAPKEKMVMKQSNENSPTAYSANQKRIDNSDNAKIKRMMRGVR